MGSGGLRRLRCLACAHAPDCCRLPCRPLPQVMAAVGMKSGGPALGRLMEAAVEWQLAHPDGTAEQCREHVQAQHAAAQQAAQQAAME